MSVEAIAAAKDDGKIIDPPPAANRTSTTGELSFITDLTEHQDWVSSSASRSRLEESVGGVP